MIANKTAVLAFTVILVSFCAACGSSTSPTESNVSAGSVGAEPAATPADVPTIMQGTPDFPFRRILCFGDSLTYGTTLRTTTRRTADNWLFLAPVEGYVPKLARLLISAYRQDVRLVNSSVGGETTTQGRARLGPALERYNPDLVLLLEGAVDVGSKNPNYLRTRRNLRAMMESVLSLDIALIIGTVPPLHPDGFRITGIENVPILNTIIREEAEAQGVPVADHETAFGDDPGLQGPDGAHPNDSGYQVIAETWFRDISDLAAAVRR